jgi:transcriptional regulator with XRE-family HTH domain
MLDEKTIGPIMKAARKFKKLNQASVAQAIGCSQSALSKMEHNLLIPSAPQWFLFARFTAIPPENLENGIIDRGTKIRFNDIEVSKGYKIPKKYRTMRAEKARELYPFLNYLQESGSSLEDYYQAVAIDREFFVDFDNLINFSLYMDTIQILVDRKLNTPEIIRSIVETGQTKTYWDHFGLETKVLKDIKEVLLELASEQIFFQTDFQLLVEIHDQKASLSYIPEYHLKNAGKDFSPEAIDFLNLYRRFTLEHLVQRQLQRVVSFEPVAEQNASPLYTRFEVNL